MQFPARFAQALENRTDTKQLIFSSKGNNVTLIQNHDATSHFERVHPMGNHERGTATHKIRHGAVDERLALSIGLAGELIEQKNGGVTQYGASQTNTLLLTARQFPATFTNGRIVTIGKASDEIVGKGAHGSLFNLFARGAARTVGYIAMNCIVEQNNILRDKAKVMAQAAQVDRPQIMPQDHHGAVIWITKTWQKRKQCGLTRAISTHYCDRFASVNLE
jgi:hypothetical protein